MSAAVVFSPHADDETLGMGGTIAKHCLAGEGVIVVCVAQHRDPQREVEFDLACQALGAVPASLSGYPDGRLGEDMSALIHTFDEVLSLYRPKTVYLPYPSPHQDHRAVYEAGIAACRVSLNPGHHWVPELLVYGEAVAELDLYPTGLRWNLFVDIEGEPLERKKHAIACHSSQCGPSPLPTNAEFLESEAIQAGGSAMLHAAERFSVLRTTR